MTLRCLIFISLCILLPSVLFAENPWTYSLCISGMDYISEDDTSGVHVREQMVGLDIRGASIRNLSGFYYGSYISIARPMWYRVFDEDDKEVDNTSENDESNSDNSAENAEEKAEKAEVVETDNKVKQNVVETNALENSVKENQLKLDSMENKISTLENSNKELTE